MSFETCVKSCDVNHNNNTTNDVHNKKEYKTRESDRGFHKYTHTHTRHPTTILRTHQSMYLYLVANPYNNNGVIKVGYMSDRRPERIVSRYKTYYGSDTTVMCWKCSNAARLEKQFKERFGPERLELELYDTRFVVRYVHWITTTTRAAPIVCTGTFMSKHIMPKHIMPKHIMSKHIMPKHIMPKHIMPKHIMPKHIMPKHIMPVERHTNEVISEPVCSRTRGGRIRAGPIGWRTRSRKYIP